MQIQTLNISLPKELIIKTDLIAQKEYRSRSELIKEALMKYLRDKGAWENLFAYGRKMGRKVGVKSEDDVNRMVEEYRNGN